MRRSRRLFALLLCLPFALLGCSKKDEGSSASGSGSGSESGSGGGGARALPKASVPDALGSLVPAEAIAVVYAPSLDGFLAKARTIASSIDPSAARGLSADDMLREVAGPAAPFVDREKPLAFAIALKASRPGRDPEPSPTMIFPLKDVEGAKKAFGDAPVTYAGSYVAIAEHGGAAAAGGANPLVSGLPAGDLVLRADLAAVVKIFQPQIDEFLSKGMKEMARAGSRGSMPGDPSGGPSGGPDMSGLFDAVGKFARDLVQSAERLDVSLKAEGTVVDLNATFRAKEGSPLGNAHPATGDLAALAGAFPKDFPVVVLLSMNLEEMMKLLEPLMKSAVESMPPESRGAFEQQMAAAKEFYALMGDSMAFGVGFGNAGLEGVSVGEAKDAKAYLAKMDEMVKKMGDSMTAMGITVEAVPTATVEGVEVRGMRMKFDWKKITASSAQGRPVPEGMEQKMESIMGSLLGKDGFRIRMGAVGNRIVATFGGDDALLQQTLAAAKKGGKPPAALAASIAKAGGKPSFLLHLELRGFLQQVLGAVGEVMPPEEAKNLPSVPSGPPLPIVIHATGDGRDYHAGASADVGEVAKLAKTMIEAGRPRPPR